MTLLTEIASDAMLDEAFAWLCKRRRDYPDCADVWTFRRNWPAEKKRLQAALLAGAFRFSLLQRIRKADGEEVDLWSARDALVLKALAMVLARHLPVSSRCHHPSPIGSPRMPQDGPRKAQESHW